MRLGREATADSNRESVLNLATANAAGSGKGHVVDFGVAAPGAASGHGDFELAGQIVELPVATQGAIDSQRERRRVEMFVVRETGDRATGDVSDHVAARTGGGESGLLQSFDDVRNSLDGDPV